MGRHYTTETPITNTGLGSTSTTDLKICFPASPLYDGTYTEEKVRELFTKLVLAPTIDDKGHTFGVVKMDFSDAPDLTQVKIGGGGLPGSPYAPNIASPASGMNPKTIPDAGVGATQRQPHGSQPFIGNGLTSPSETSNKIATQNRKLGDLIFGQSYKK